MDNTVIHVDGMPIENINNSLKNIENSDLSRDKVFFFVSDIIEDSISIQIKKDTTKITKESIKADSLVKDSTLTDSLVKDSTLTDSLVKDSTLTDSLVKDSTLTDSLVKDSTLTDSLVKDSLATDSLVKDSLATDSLIPDSLRYVFKSDTMMISGGVLPVIREKFLDEQIREAGLQDSLASGLLREEDGKLIGDSIDVDDFGTRVALSVILPGFGQIKNKQYWKLPILYTTTGTLAYLSINASKKFKIYKNAYDAAALKGVPKPYLDDLMRKRNNYSTQKTVFMVGTALTYIYFIGDAALDYKGNIHPTRKATILSSIFPGAGQVYNKSYWKLPIIYGGFVACGYVIDYNNRGYQRFKAAYNARTDGDDSTIDEFHDQGYSTEFIQNTRDSFRRYRDLGIIITCGLYILNIVDAHVDAYLRRYDISDDLSMVVEPTLIPRVNSVTGPNQDGFGMALKINF